MSGRIILTSRGLNTQIGQKLIEKALKGSINLRDRILLITMAEYGINNMLRDACVKIGFSEQNISIFDGETELDIEQIFQFLYVSEGNTFEVLDMMKKQGLMEIVKKNFDDGADYIGSSAGAMIAGYDVKLAHDFDRNFVQINDFSGLNLFDGTVIPHYTKQQFRRYCESISDEIKKKYNNIYSVSNESALIINEAGLIRTIRVRAD